MTKETKTPAIFLTTELLHNVRMGQLFLENSNYLSKSKFKKESIMKKLILFLLCCSIYASADPVLTPTDPAYTVSGSVESNSSSNTIHGETTGLSVINKSGRFTNSGNIWGDNEYGAYIQTNSWYPYRFNNNGNVSSDNATGIQIIGDNIYFDNGHSGSVYGGKVGININTLTGGGPENVIEIDNKGRIESGGTAIQINDSHNKTINIDNGFYGYIGGDNIGIDVRNGALANITNEGHIDATNGPAIYMTSKGMIVNDGLISSKKGAAVISEQDLTLTGNGNYSGKITYSGTGSGSLILNNINQDPNDMTARFQGDNALLNWHEVNVNGGLTFIDAFSSDVNIKNGRSEIGKAGNLFTDSSIISPYNGSNTQAFMDYDNRRYSKLSVNNLKMTNNSTLKIDMKVETHTPSSGISEEGFGYNENGYRIMYDQLYVNGTSSIEDSTKLTVMDFSQSLGSDPHLENVVIQPFISDGATLDDFQIVLYSDTYHIDHQDSDFLYLAAAHEDDGGTHRVCIPMPFGPPICEDVPNNPAPIQTQKLNNLWLLNTNLENIKTPYNPLFTDLAASLELKNEIYWRINGQKELNQFLNDLNKMEYASLATSNINSIDNRVSNLFEHLNSGFRDANGINIWADAYYTDFSLDGTGNHDISGNGMEFAVGFDKQLTESFKFGFSFNHIDYNTVVNDSGVDTNIDSEGYGANLFAQYQQADMTHKISIGFAQYDNVNKDVASFDSSEMFAAYRAEYKIKTAVVDISPLAGLRYASVKYGQIKEDSQNGLKSYTTDSLETELGVKIAKQFKKLNVTVSGSWIHELLDTQNVATAYTSFGEFEQQGIDRDADSFRASVGVQYQISENVSFGLDYAKDMSSNSESNSINGKLSFNF